jgi:Glycosyl transferase family 2
VKIVLALRTRDQAELVDANVSFHLNVGIDFVIATDHRSEDGTFDILRAYEREGCLRLIREDGEWVRGSEWRTRMARLAALEHGADWVLHGDGDEFWWPRAGSLKAVLETIPERYGAVRGLWRIFAPRPDDERFFAERMTVRLTQRAPINESGNLYRPNAKVAHRANPSVTVDRGGHSLLNGAMNPLRGWYPVEVFHFPIRSRAQMEEKFLAWSAQLPRLGRTGNPKANTFHQQGRMDQYHAALMVGEDQLERGLADGSLAVDTRLRDALRSLRRDGTPTVRQFMVPSERAEPLALPAPGPADAAGFAVDAAALGDTDVLRLLNRLDELESRITSVGRRPWRLRRAPV